MILLFTFYLIVFLAAGALLFTLWVNHVIFFRTIVVTLTIFLIVFILGWIYFSRQYVDSLPEVRVPDVEGRSLEKAIELIEAAGLKHQIIAEAFHMDIGKGKVILQKPKKLRTEKTGQTVRLVVSRGRRSVTIPDLIGKTLSQARAVLRENGIILKGVTEQAAEGASAGIIIEQTLAPGSSAEIGSLIYVTAVKGESAGVQLTPEVDGILNLKGKEEIQDER